MSKHLAHQEGTRVKNHPGRPWKLFTLLLCVLLVAASAGATLHFGQELSRTREALKQAQTALEESEAALAISQTVLSEVQAETEAVLAAKAEAEARIVEIEAARPAYQDLYPDFYAPQPLTADQASDGVMHLTFDDGPSPRTPELLEILREENAKATFFVIGEDSEQAKEWMRSIVTEGHTIGMHSYSHKYNEIYDSVEAYLDDMYRVFTLIKETTGVTPTLFRFPGGSINAYNYGISQDLITEMLRRGFVPYDWNLSGKDAEKPTASSSQIVANIVNHAGGQRGIALLHDTSAKTRTVAALRPMIQQLRNKGYAFESLTPDSKPILYGYRY